MNLIESSLQALVDYIAFIYGFLLMTHQEEWLQNFTKEYLIPYLTTLTEHSNRFREWIVRSKIIGYKRCYLDTAAVSTFNLDDWSDDVNLHGLAIFLWGVPTPFNKFVRMQWPLRGFVRLLPPFRFYMWRRALVLRFQQPHRDSSHNRLSPGSIT